MGVAPAKPSTSSVCSAVRALLCVCARAAAAAFLVILLLLPGSRRAAGGGREEGSDGVTVAAKSTGLLTNTRRKVFVIVYLFIVSERWRRLGRGWFINMAPVAAAPSAPFETATIKVRLTTVSSFGLM